LREIPKSSQTSAIFSQRKLHDFVLMLYNHAPQMLSNRDGEVVGWYRKSLNRLELPDTR
jgi:hypothetical protein